MATTKIKSEKLGIDIWLTDKKKFKSTDGSPVYYESELPVLRKKTDEELKLINAVKLVFPGCVVKS